ncbi:MAG TPA: LysR family transcriptional regulator [Candidatus Saccharimonadia bacterium]|nr:LysR family transcriptional regulator [Candidatus Saccharimonadia bacterium]
MSNPRISLDQWRALVAVVDAGGYAQAASRLNKSQSAVTYSVQRLESLLGVKAFEIHGRKAVLTPTGRLLHRRARALLEEADAIERASRSLSAGWEAEIRIAVEIIFPTYLLLATLDRFGADSPHTHIELFESVLGGTQEALLQGRVDLAIAPQVPQGFHGEALMRLRFVPAAHPSHPLHALGRAVTMRDLRAHRQVVVRDTGSTRNTRGTVVEAKQRWTVGHMATSILAVRSGYGFAWYPEDKIRLELEAGTLALLPMADSGERFAELYLVYADREGAGPGTLRLAALLRESVAESCAAGHARAADAKRTT